MEAQQRPGKTAAKQIRFVNALNTCNVIRPYSEVYGLLPSTKIASASGWTCVSARACHFAGKASDVLKARLAVIAKARNHGKILVHNRTMIQIAMAKFNGENTLLKTHHVHAFVDDVAAAHTQRMKAGVTDLRGPHRLTEQECQPSDPRSSSDGRTPKPSPGVAQETRTTCPNGTSEPNGSSCGSRRPLLSHKVMAPYNRGSADLCLSGDGGAVSAHGHRTSASRQTELQNDRRHNHSNLQSQHGGSKEAT